MRVYNTKHFLKILFSLHKSDTLKILFPTMVLIGLYSWGIQYLEVEHLHLSSKSPISNVSMIHSLLGFVLSLLLVFRTNTAYDRWWEGRKLWGKLVNDSRNFAIKINTILADDRKNTDQIARYLKFFPHFLAKHLSKESTRLALDEDYSEIEEYIKHCIDDDFNLLVLLKNNGKINMSLELAKDFEKDAVNINQFRIIQVANSFQRIK